MLIKSVWSVVGEVLVLMVGVQTTTMLYISVKLNQECLIPLTHHSVEFFTQVPEYTIFVAALFVVVGI